jgi:DNA polymerase (family 10)
VIPLEQLPYALLYFTGSMEFNVGFRKHALKMGYTLNEHEMKLTGKVEGAKAVPPLATEEDVFAFLGLEYKGPKERTGVAAVKVVDAAEAPKAAEGPKAPKAAEEPKAASPSKKKAKWVEKVSKTTGKTYWWNRETKQSTWEKPASLKGGTRRSKRSTP